MEYPVTKVLRAPATAEEHANAMMAETRQAVIAADAATREVARQVGYELPGGAIDPDLIQRDIAANMRRSVEACMEVGRGLTVLKSAVGHGQFLARLEVLGVDDRLARRFMSAAHKFSNRASTPVLKAAGSQTKLLELLVLDDEQVEELAETGKTGELKLDDVACMSVSELRKALREARATCEARKKAIDQKSETIDELQEQLALKTPEPAPARKQEIIDPAKEALAALEEAQRAVSMAVLDLRSKLVSVKDVLTVGPRLLSIQHAALERAAGDLREAASALGVPLKFADEQMPRTDEEIGRQWFADLDAQADKVGDSDDAE
ncbi:MAG: hypothetical protein LBI92_06760 [Azoarcus sp.]|jgi:hypothetical protein|nr:hypothetical protein [Azoarcus sp.]